MDSVAISLPCNRIGDVAGRRAATAASRRFRRGLGDRTRTCMPPKSSAGLCGQLGCALPVLTRPKLTPLVYRLPVLDKRWPSEALLRNVPCAWLVVAALGGCLGLMAATVERSRTGAAHTRRD